MYGYSEPFKAYRLYYPKTNEIIIMRDVIFNESCKTPSKSYSCSHTYWSIISDHLLKKIWMTCPMKTVINLVKRNYCCKYTRWKNYDSSTKIRILQGVYQ